MKKFPWLYITVLTLFVGLPLGGLVGQGVAFAHRSIPLGVASGCVFGFLLISLITLYYRRAMLKRDPNFTLGDLATRRTTTLVLPVSADDAFDLCVESAQYLPGFFAFISSKAELKIEGTTGGGGGAGYFSLGAPGERITVAIKPLAQQQAEVTLESRPATFFIVLDFGKNRQNLNAISKGITYQITRRFEGQREATQRAEMQRALTEAKLSVLEAHIEPHFLYNTLANAQLLIRQDPKRADEMLGNLITYLRASVPSPDRQSEAPQNGMSSTLGREIERSSAYLEILKIRMGSRLNVRIDMPETLAGRGFPAMMVQTLVENSIKHGLESKPGGGTISINAATTTTQLVLTVSDDGIGLREGTSGTGLGLKNIRDRLRLSFNGQATFSLKPNLPCGMVAAISIPLHGTNENEK